MENIERLYKCYPILKKINDENNHIIDNTVQFKKLYADDRMNNTSTGSCIGIVFVLEGMIKIQRISKDGGETNLFNLTMGDFCHEALSCLLELRSLNIEGRALQDSLICIIPPNVVREYLFKSPEFLCSMYMDLYKKFDSVIEGKEEKLHDSVETRLIKYLKDKNSKVIYATHKEIAFEIDTSREVVSRKLKEFEKKGYLSLERGKIVINKLG